MNQPIEAEVVQPQPQTQAVAVRETGGAVGILRPADSLDAIAEAFAQYRAVCERILDDSDYQDYEGKKRKKKSAWRKLATAFNVSTSLVKEQITRDTRGHVVSVEYTVRAFTGPESNPWRQMVGVGHCDVHEKCCPSSEGGKCRKAAWKTHFCCVKGCDGRKHWSHPDHDVISTAQTRASNRAVADLIGCGEVSAEELTGEADNESKEQPAPAPKPSQKPKPAPAKAATDATRTWMIKELHAGEGEAARQIVTEFFTKVNGLLEGAEQIEDLPLQFVPVSKSELSSLIAAIGAFESGEPAAMPYHHPIVVTPKEPEAPTEADAIQIDPSWQFMEGIIDQVSVKTGKKKNGEEWTLYGIRMDAKWANTFSNRIGEVAQAAHKEKRSVKVYYFEGDSDRLEAQEIV